MMVRLDCSDPFCKVDLTTCCFIFSVFMLQQSRYALLIAILLSIESEAMAEKWRIIPTVHRKKVSFLNQERKENQLPSST